MTASDHLRPSTRSRDQGAAKNWLLPHLGDKALGDITKHDVDTLVQKMQSAGLAKSTVRTYFGVLQAVMTAAVDAELIVRTPCRGIRLSAERRADPRFLDIDEVHCLADTIDPSYRAMVYLAAIVGLRFGECAGLRVGRVDFFRRTVSVVETATEVGSDVIFGAPKTNMGRRTVSVPRFVANELSAHLKGRVPVDPEELVFTSPQGAPLRRKHFPNRGWLPTVKQAGLDGLTFHGLRHSAAGLMIQADTHPRVMQTRLGHASFRTTMDTYGSSPSVSTRPRSPPSTRSSRSRAPRTRLLLSGVIPEVRSVSH